MYATMTLFTTKPGMREAMEKLADDLSHVFSGLKGFKSEMFIVDPEVDEYGGFVVWESKEDAEAARETTGSLMQEALSEIVKGPPIRRMFEVYEPKG
ncbi:antibiotic biosynthesis monooxygenase family protein [Thermodesulfobacteriota bacterium]